MNEEESIGRLRQGGREHMEIAWQHVGVVVVMLSRRLECWVLGSGRDGGR